MSLVIPGNAAGEVAFTAILAGTGGSPEGLFAPTSGTGSPLGLVAFTGDAAPGTTDAVFDNFASFAFNAQGDLVFEAFLDNAPGETGVTSDNELGIFALIDGELELLLRTGDLFDVFVASIDATEQRTIADLDLDSVSLSDTGALALAIDFTDGSSGIFTTTIPEPASALLAGLITPLLMCRRRLA